MSYEIVYDHFCAKIPFDALMEQANSFFQEKLHIAESELGNDQIWNLMRTRYGFYINGDVYELQFLIGSSNCYDTETNRRVRNWQFVDMLEHYEMLIKYGCEWCKDAEGGMLKVNGRWITAEGWIKKVRGILANPIEYPDYTHNQYMHFEFIVPVEDGDDKQKALNSFESLCEGLNVSVKKCKYQHRSSETRYDIAGSFENAFETKLFVHLAQSILGKKWISGSRPAYHFVRREAV